MEDPPTKPPIIEYATPEQKEPIWFLDKMLDWRSMCGGCFLLTVLCASCVWPIALVAAIGTIASATMTFIYMTKAAASEVGPAYAVRQLVLAMLLLPIFLLGVYLVPILVKSDLMKWRRMEDRNTTKD